MGMITPIAKFEKRIQKREQILPKTNLVQNFKVGAFFKALPSTTALKSYCNFVYDQADLGSCVPCAVCAAIRITDPKNPFEPSILQLYTNVIKKENNGQIIDEGTDAVDVCEILRDIGVCSTSFMPYNPSNFGQEPSIESMMDAAKHKYTGFQNITPTKQLFQTIKIAIASNTPVLLAFYVPKSFRNIGTNGIMPIVPDGEEVIGGHEVLVLNYNNKYLTCLNSWGKNWGQNGFFKMPVDFLSRKYYGNRRYVVQLVTLRAIIA